MNNPGIKVFEFIYKAVETRAVCDSGLTFIAINNREPEEFNDADLFKIREIVEKKDQENWNMYVNHFLKLYGYETTA